MDRKIRVGAVSYLNTKPLIYGFERGMMQDKIDLVIDYPANIASALLKNEIDVGLVPVAIIPEMKEYYIISDYGIGANGDVASVCLFSDVPIKAIETVLLDYQSRTSVELIKILMKEFWKINPVIKNTSDGFSSLIQGTTAAVIIGDRALEQRTKSRYIYDLAGAWKQFTGLPFVFAAWVSNKPLPDNFIIEFNKANEYGLNNIDRIVQLNPYPMFDLKKYYTEYISYMFDIEKKNGMHKFIVYLKQPVA